MHKTQGPGPNESWLKNPPAIFDERLVEEMPTWESVERARLQQQQAHATLPPSGSPTLGTYVDLLLLKVCGREPLSTLVMTFAGCLVGAAQDDPTNWRGWLHGAVFALAGRLMNERS